MPEKSATLCARLAPTRFRGAIVEHPEDEADYGGGEHLLHR